MKVIIQCAARKDSAAGYLKTRDGQRILFVAHPEKAPRSGDVGYAKPDDRTEDGRTWRQVLVEYNQSADANPLGLAPAYRLYEDPRYAQLVTRFGVDNVMILSAGWGLLPADFLTPQYDITFTANAEPYKRRGKRDRHDDFRLDPHTISDDLVFFGGKAYLPLFDDLTRDCQGRRFVFFNSVNRPDCPGCTLIRYNTAIKTNWHYACAADFAEGRVVVPG